MKYIIWLKDVGEVPECYSVGKHWTEQGDGPLTETQANRIAEEIRRMGSCFVRVLPAGMRPPNDAHCPPHHQHELGD